MDVPNEEHDHKHTANGRPKWRTWSQTHSKFKSWQVGNNEKNGFAIKANDLRRTQVLSTGLSQDLNQIKKLWRTLFADGVLRILPNYKIFVLRNRLIHRIKFANAEIHHTNKTETCLRADIANTDFATNYSTLISYCMFHVFCCKCYHTHEKL